MSTLQKHSMNISIIRNGVEIGEWTEEEVREFYREGRLVDTDSYWREGMNEWTSLSRLIRPAPSFPTKSPPGSVPDFPMTPPPSPPASQKTKKTGTQKFNISEDISEAEVKAELAAPPAPLPLPLLPNISPPPLPSNRMTMPLHTMAIPEQPKYPGLWATPFLMDRLSNYGRGSLLNRVNVATFVTSSIKTNLNSRRYYYAASYSGATH
jgi:hypothetical protein